MPTIPQIAARKNGEKIVAITAYTAPMAKLLDEYVDLILVGDSLATQIYGYDNTISVTIETMITHAKAVKRQCKNASVIVDMPFGSVEVSPEQAFVNCARVLKETHANGVKIEGGVEMAPTIEKLVNHGIPVMGHVGLLPQRVNAMGGFKVQGKNEDSAKLILADAQAVAGAGAFAIVIEGVMEAVARQITQQVAIPTIGIGASPDCDGQILVCDDMIGFNNGYTAKFVRKFGDVAGEIQNAAKNYAQAVRDGTFPSTDELYGIQK